MRIIATVSLIAAMASPAAAVPAFQDGNRLLDFCQSQGANEGQCYGYVAGVVDTAALLDTPYFCLPNGVAIKQVRDVVERYLDDHPEKRHFPAQALVFSAIAEAWPCQ